MPFPSLARIPTLMEGSAGENLVLYKSSLSHPQRRTWQVFPQFTVFPLPDVGADGSTIIYSISLSSNTRPPLGLDAYAMAMNCPSSAYLFTDTLPLDNLRET